MEKKKRRKPEAAQRRNNMGEKMPAASQISGDSVLSVDEIFAPRPLLMKPLSQWARACAGTSGNMHPDELVTIKLTNFSQIEHALIHSNSTAAIAAFSKLGR
jgi:hypothetical protein